MVFSLSRLHNSDKLHSEGVFWTSDEPEQRPVADNKQHIESDIHAHGGIQTCSSNMWVVTDPTVAHADTWFDYSTVYIYIIVSSSYCNLYGNSFTIVYDHDMF
jgi:hypothetical protein